MDAHREFFEKLAEEWDAQQPRERQEHIRKLLIEFTPFLADSRRLLSVGSGTGVLPDILEQIDPGITVFSLDVAFAMLRFHRSRDKKTRLVQGDVHFLPFLACTFDSIICHNSFPHFHDHPKALREMVRILENGKWLVILHDTSREKVNSVHTNANSWVIHHDLLPDARRLSGLFSSCGLSKIKVFEGCDFFLAIGQKEPEGLIPVV